MRSKENVLSLYFCWLVLLGYIALTIACGKWSRHTVIKNDAAGYYVYLSSIFVYNDLMQCKFYPHLDSMYNPGDGVVYYAVQQNHETGNFYFKYNYGVALFEAPLFLLIHGFVNLSKLYPSDGYSAPYQLSVALSAVLFSFFALLLLRSFLLSYFSDKVVLITLFIIACGTNFFAQVITQPGLSHTYLFFLYCAILYSTQKLYKTVELKYGLFLGVSLGWCLVTRSIDVFVCAIPLFWIYSQVNNLQDAAMLFKRHYKQMSLVALAIGGFIFIQMLYWKITTNHWYFYTYRKEHFDFNNWQIVNGLFSFRKGWFVYTPLALLGFIGIYFVWKKKELRFYILPITLYFLLTLYFVFCWWQWYYGGSFGCRVLVQSLALLALPMAALVEFVISSGWRTRIVSAIVVLFFVGLNIFQTAQYAKGVIHWQKMNRDYYWKVFGKWSVSDDDKKLLLQTEELH
ncbi:MAG: hypothetical protein U0T74_01415 [Chitinophagales bacterium]